jgi:hypothetical protein
VSEAEFETMVPDDADMLVVPAPLEVPKPVLAIVATD